MQCSDFTVKILRLPGGFIMLKTLSVPPWMFTASTGPSTVSPDASPLGPTHRAHSPTAKGMSAMCFFLAAIESDCNC